MERIDYEAKSMTERTGETWRPIRMDGVDMNYILSESGRVFNFRKRRYLRIEENHSSRKYCRLRSDKQQKTFQLDALLLSIFPERYDEDHDQEWRRIFRSGEATDYEVSENGDVRRINNHHIIKPAVHKAGYHMIRLRHCGKTITEYVHRLVAMAFIPNPNGYELVNHKDENRQNNAACNLEWCDRRYNMLYNGASKRAVSTRRMHSLSG